MPVIVRQAYWKQGGPGAGFQYRLGRITVDGIAGSSRHFSPNATFLPNASTAMFTVAAPDSGFAATGAFYPTPRAYIGGVVSDANANRFTWGDLGEGQLFKLAEVGLIPFPLTEKAGYWKAGIFHNDGSKDGLPTNGMTGREGWGYYFKLEQELSRDGRLVGILRYGQSFRAAIYDQQASVHLLYYDPLVLLPWSGDVIGGAFNWVQSASANTRDEYNLEVFYRFPLFEEVDTTLSYQSVWNPAFTRRFDQASVFSLRLTTSF